MSNQPSPRVQKLINTMQEAAQRTFDKAKKEQKDPGMMAMYAGDARDMFRIAEMMREGNYEAALRKARDMDTAARDEIPEKVYLFLEEEVYA